MSPSTVSNTAAETDTEKGQQHQQNSPPKPTLRDKLNKPLNFHLAILSLLIMIFIVSFDATALAVGIPVASPSPSIYIISSLQSPGYRRGTRRNNPRSLWANITFLRTVAIVQPIYTSTSDILGRKLPLYVAFFLFGLSSIIFAVAGALPAVILGGGGIGILNEIIVADMTTLCERAFYMACSPSP